MISYTSQLKGGAVIVHSGENSELREGRSRWGGDNWLPRNKDFSSGAEGGRKDEGG